MEPYEFDEHQDEIVAALARAMINVSMLTLLCSGLILARSLWLWFALKETGGRPLAALGLAGSLGELVIAFMLVGAGRKLILIPRTEGEDMPNLMAGLSRLSSTYLVQAITLACLLVVILWVAFQ